MRTLRLLGAYGVFRQPIITKHSFIFLYCYCYGTSLGKTLLTMYALLLFVVAVAAAAAAAAAVAAAVVNTVSLLSFRFQGICVIWYTCSVHGSRFG